VRAEAITFLHAARLPSKSRGVPSIDRLDCDGIVVDTEAFRSMPASYARRRYFARFLFVIRPILKPMSVLLAGQVRLVTIQMPEGAQTCVKPPRADVKGA
jgi:hypothetical protein